MTPNVLYKNLNDGLKAPIQKSEQVLPINQGGTAMKKQIIINGEGRIVKGKKHFSKLALNQFILYLISTEVTKRVSKKIKNDWRQVSDR